MKVRFEGAQDVFDRMVYRDCSVGTVYEATRIQLGEIDPYGVETAYDDCIIIVDDAGDKVAGRLIHFTVVEE